MLLNHTQDPLPFSSPGTLCQKNFLRVALANRKDTVPKVGTVFMNEHSEVIKSISRVCSCPLPERKPTCSLFFVYAPPSQHYQVPCPLAFASLLLPGFPRRHNRKNNTLVLLNIHIHNHIHIHKGFVLCLCQVLSEFCR